MAKKTSSKPKSKKKLNVKLLVVGGLVVLSLLLVALAFVLPGNADTTANAGTQGEYISNEYQAYLDLVGYESTEQLATDTVTVDITAFELYDPDAELSTDAAVETPVAPVEEATDTEEPVDVKLIPDAAVIGTTTDIDGNEVTGLQIGERANVRWKFTAPADGYYNLRFNYISIKSTTSNPQRDFLLDNAPLYYDKVKKLKLSPVVEFTRTWDNGTIKETDGNEIRPEANEDFVAKDIYLSDTTMRTLSPYVIYLTAGEHTLELEANREPVQINEISFEKAPIAPTYAEYLKLHKDAKEYSGENLVMEAERYEGGTVKITKSSTSIGASTDYSSSYTTPYHHWNQLLNVMGGSNWATAGGSITWTIEVPEEGFYQIAPRARQNVNRGVKSFRRVKINGEVPFQEANKIGFDYSTSFENYVISDSEGKALLFYLNKGKNTITMDVVLGDFANALSEVENSVLVLNEMYRKVVQITGTVPDTYIDYEIGTKVKGVQIGEDEYQTFAETMKDQADALYAVVDEMVKITGEKGSGTIQLEKVARQCAQFAEKPDDVVDEISDFKSNISALGTWMLEISSMPLEVDSFTLSKPGATLKNAEPNALVAAGNETIRFLATFVVDDTQIASDKEVSKDAVKVWIASGRDQAQIIRNLIDNTYEDGSVNLQLIPAGVLLPATLAGNGPDVSLSNGQASVVDFAVRGALQDLTEFDDYEEFISDMDFKPSAINTASYNGGVYGLPETQTFSVLFYRTDILEELGLEVPKTWGEVEEAINVLHINNYDFYIPTSALYSTLVYQYGGDMYHGAAGTVDENGYKFAADGSDYGIRSGLRDEPAMLAFQKLTEFFTTYALPVSADFSNRFRTGEIPIGIADYTLFNTLEIFAPEIKGLWSFAPMPGYEDPVTGEINNSVVSASAHTVMMNSAKDKQASWEFIKWWLSEETQLGYGTTIESILGSGARYSTANINVLRQLPWAAEQADVIVEQFDNTIGVPDVPGYYMTGREIDYAFKGVVTDGQNPREALYLNVKEINDELTIKREEFHLTRYNEEGEIIDD
ncbi:MAG: extracellular solute-binding protein [Clostridia bacterium]|nr:extracellular solute-binding protein [Clostridia bacterium]